MKIERFERLIKIIDTLILAISLGATDNEEEKKSPPSRTEDMPVPFREEKHTISFTRTPFGKDTRRAMRRTHPDGKRTKN